tara:strand:- start:8277 stop:8924 length:648 start_codon:yes stop_codon:yes gene_type:complete
MKHVPIEDLIPYDKNPRNNEKAIEAVAQSIDQNGFVQPIVINQDGVICIGHTRWLAAQMLELTEVPVIVKEMTSAEFIKLNIADNKVGELATWDDDLLGELIHELDGMDDIEIPGMDMKELDDILFAEEKAEAAAAKKKAKDELNEVNQSESGKDAGPTRKLVYIFSIKDANVIDGKLQAIMKEQKILTEAEALLYALKSFKGPKRVKVAKVQND